MSSPIDFQKDGIVANGCVKKRSAKSAVKFILTAAPQDHRDRAGVPAESSPPLVLRNGSSLIGGAFALLADVILGKNAVPYREMLYVVWEQAPMRKIVCYL